MKQTRNHTHDDARADDRKVKRLMMGRPTIEGVAAMYKALTSYDATPEEIERASEVRQGRSGLFGGARTVRKPQSESDTGRHPQIFIGRSLSLVAGASVGRRTLLCWIGLSPVTGNTNK